MRETAKLSRNFTNFIVSKDSRYTSAKKVILDHSEKKKILSGHKRDFYNHLKQNDYLLNVKVDAKKYIQANFDTKFKKSIKNFEANLYTLTKLNDQISAQKPNLSSMIEDIIAS